MKNLKKSFSFFYNLNVKNIKCIAKNRNSIVYDGLQNSLNVLLATEDSVYTYSYFNNDLKLLCKVSEGEVSITSIFHDDISESLVICLKNGEILTYQIDNGVVGEAIVVANVPNGIESAEWSPDREILIVTNPHSLYLLSATYYDIICEIKPTTVTIGENVQVNVGWGKKETQFHGSEGKAAAKKTKVVIDSSLINDNHETHISWRGDSQLFSVSYWDESCNQRFIKMFEKSGSLLATNEELSGLTGPISWRPYGDLLAFSERTPDHYAIGFLEKNGLKHGDFNLPSNLKIKKVLWNNDSNILATVCIEDATSSECLLLWTTCNYHWYLKQKIVFSSPLECVIWDDTRGNRLYGVCQDSSVFVAEWVTTVDSTKELCLGSDSGYVSVIDNGEVLLTSFREAIIPPPMSRWSLACNEAVNSILFPSWSDTGEGCVGSSIICTISHSNKFILWKRDGDTFTISENFNLPLECQEPGLNASLNHWIWFKSDSFATVQIVNGSKSILKLFKNENSDVNISTVELPFCAISLHYCEKDFLIQSSVGALYKVNAESLELVDSLKLPEPCNRLEFNVNGIFSLSEKYRLYKDSVHIGSQINSFLLHGSFLLATTSLHTLVIYKNSTNKCTEILSRKLENGSRLVVATETTVVFQLPRGNLEAIQPRALTVETVGRLLDNNKFKEAISLLSRQRIDLNLAVDHNSNHFLESTKEFVRQVDPKWLTLLITELRNDCVIELLFPEFYKKNHSTFGPLQKIEKVCNALYTAMSEDVEKYILPIMGTFVKLGQTSQALELATTEESLQHLLFLVDVDRLYNEALLAYNLEAALKIAGKSQKDPKEYLPYLNKLRAMDENYMKFTIDKTLGRPGSALKHIAACEGEDRFKECVQLVKDHSLYANALNLFLPHTNNKYKVIAELYGDYLSTYRRFTEAGIMYRRSGAIRKAIEAYIKKGEWRQCIELSYEAGYSDKEKEEMFQTLKGVLKGTQKYQEAGMMCLEALQDVQGCIEMLLVGKLWREAIRVAKSNGQPSLMDDVKKSLLENSESLFNEMKSLQENFSKHLSRLRIVRENKNKPVAESTLAEPWEGQSDASSVSTRSTFSSCSRSSKNSKKAMRKLWSLKEGNPREEQGLLHALSTLYEAIEKITFEVNPTCFGLLEFDCDTIAAELQAKCKHIVGMTVKTRSLIWPGCYDIDDLTAMDEKLKNPPQSRVMDCWELEMLKPTA